jgi:hypothetical protein
MDSKQNDRLDDFVRAYLKCILWSENDESTPAGGEPLENNYSLEDFSQDALKQAVEDCRTFREANAADLTQYNHFRYTAEELGGHDFWLTRNGHGSGFWDRHTCLPKDARDRLSDAARAAGECNPYVGDDGLIYFL